MLILYLYLDIEKDTVQLTAAYIKAELRTATDLYGVIWKWSNFLQTTGSARV